MPGLGLDLDMGKKSARAVVQSRMESAVAALENIRLDLLRLHAGVGSHDELTADLERARAIGEEIDRLLEGQQEVTEMLESKGTIPR